MMEDLPMDEFTSVPPYEPVPDFASSHEMSDTPTDGTWSLNDSGPSTPTHENDSVADPKSQVVKPYAIEEPPEEPKYETRNLELPSLPDFLERWQRDLTDYMENLDWKSNLSASTRLHTNSQKRGQKRKPTHPATTRYSNPPRKTKLEDPRCPCPRLSLKRQRRCNKPVPDTPAAHDTAFRDFRETQSNESSSPDQQSPTASMNDSATEMDID
ncbi:hypothetical protein NUU61_000791 [Penicillium alfredii]|uniref:Uncharacterized protein n=1 Tax=Penicillium alfredii TaxID=1506179 RepID=A0A9W9GAL3_9EURO|nr:uncharacterized protein NUU61_000791 [Penicillium alfredii]KAJ5115032.1 hypothetical protein NUU61_000791 [Penicillium alfredii]